MPGKPLNIYEYNDYRVFLRDYFAWCKANDDTFTQRGFAARAGFSAHSFCNYLVNGERNLTRESCKQLCAALALSGKETDFFSLLVQYNQSTATDERDILFTRLNALRRNTTFYRLNKKHFAYLDQWFHPALRELVVLSNWGGDFARLGKMLVPSITPGQARRGVKVLQSMGLIRKNTDASWSQSSDAVVVKDFPSHLVKKARNTYIRMAMDASENLDAKTRNISCATVTLSKESYKKVSDMLDAVHDYVVSLSTKKEKAEKVYQLNFQLFPTSKDIHENQGGDDASAD
jgi:uncharacterized protein (TIGR02147 family)